MRYILKVIFLLSSAKGHIFIIIWDSRMSYIEKDIVVVCSRIIEIVWPDVMPHGLPGVAWEQHPVGGQQKKLAVEFWKCYNHRLIHVHQSTNFCCSTILHHAISGCNYFRRLKISPTQFSYCSGGLNKFQLDIFTLIGWKQREIYPLPLSTLLPQSD